MKHLTIGSQWINALLIAFENQGLSVADITQGLPGFVNNKLRQGQRLQVSTARQLWHQAIASANDPLLGLKVGRELDFRALGVLMPVLWHSPSPRVAINNVLAYQTLTSESGVYKLSQYQTAAGAGGDVGAIKLSYIPTVNALAVAPQQVLSVVIGLIEILAGLSNQKVTPCKLTVPSGLDAELIATEVSYPVEYQNGNLTIIFSTTYLDEILVGSDPHLYEINKAYAEQLLRHNSEGLALIERVKNVVAESNYAEANIDQLEASLGLGKRTLQRNLSEQGTSFRLLKEEVLKERAVELLITEQLDIERVAKSLGYSEPSAFHRAFRTWFGATPKQFGRAHR